MKSVKVHIKNKKGLHARPSSLFVQLVTKYDSDISVKSEDETVNGERCKFSEDVTRGLSIYFMKLCWLQMSLSFI